VAAEHPDAAPLLRTAEADVLARWAANGRREAVEILLDLGVPVDARGPTGLTALQEATRCEDPELVALLLQRGADPRKRAAAGPRPAADEPPYGELGWAAQAAYLRLLATSPWPSAGRAATASP
jgi:ankyrin repeat protein